MEINAANSLPLHPLNGVSSPDANNGARDVRHLTRSIARGSESAFGVFYDEYSPQLFRFLLVLARGDEQFAEELHQRAMIKAARKMPELQDQEQLWKWLAQVARNTWRDALRKRKREGHALSVFKNDDQPNDAAPECLESLQYALETLPPNQRALIQSFYFEEQKQNAIAKRTGLSVKAIQCELSRIRKKLYNLIIRRRHE